MDTITHEREERLAEIADMIADLFSVSADEVRAATSFVDELGADSLLAIELLTQLEKRYQVVIPEEEMTQLINLETTFAVVACRAGW